MKLDGLIFMLHFLTYAFKREEDPNSIPSKQREINLTTVFTVCYDVFSGFAHFSPFDSTANRHEFARILATEVAYII